MKPGLKSTEFYAFLLGLGTVIFQFVQTKCAFGTTDVMPVVALVVAYIGGRTWVKVKAGGNVGA